MGRAGRALLPVGSLSRLHEAPQMGTCKGMVTPELLGWEDPVLGWEDPVLGDPSWKRKEAHEGRAVTCKAQGSGDA